MSGTSASDDRLLAMPERELVDMTHAPAIDGLSEAELQAIAKRLRAVRDRAQRIARQQQREIRGKAEPRGATADPGADRQEADGPEAGQRRRRGRPASRSRPNRIGRHEGENKRPADRDDGPARGRTRVEGGEVGAGQARPKLTRMQGWRP